MFPLAFISRMSKNKVSLKKLRDCRVTTNGRDHVPLPTGRYQKIGCRDLMVGLSRKSGVLVRLYYPAKGDDGPMNPLLWPNWLPHEAYKQGLADFTNIKSKFIIRMLERSGRSNVFIPAIPNAKLMPLPKNGPDRYPVVVFSHGLGGCRTAYSAMCCELASQGFVVAAVEHRDNSACMSFYPKRATYSFKNSNPDFFGAVDEVDAEDEVDFGDELDDPNYVPPKALAAMTSLPHLELAWVRYRYVPVTRNDDAVQTFRNRQIHQRVRECTRALDLIEAMNAGYEINNLLDPGYNPREFENMLDMEKVIVMGHSFGGGTVLMAGATELRFKVVISLDPWMFPIKNESYELITQPVLIICTETLAMGDNKRQMEEFLNSGEDRHAVVINGSGHMQQCDVPYVIGWLALLATGWSFRKRISSFEVHDLSVYLALRFIAKHLDIPIDDRIHQYLEEQKKKIRPLIKKKK